jgi:DNA-binding transcriptional LysR family regulator
MQAFRRVVELHSFRAAGLSLSMTGGAVSKLVAQLERDLGVRLLHRTTRTVSVNAEGTTFYEAAVRVLDDLDASVEAVHARSAAPVGRLKVSVPTSFALMWLSARLPAFVEAYPALELDLVLNDRYVDLVQEGFDCAIRIATRLPDSTLVARPLGTVERWLVASPQYLQDAPPLEHPDDLESHACLGYSQSGEPIEWPVKVGKPLEVNAAFRVNNSVMLRDLLLAGLGVTLTPAFVVHDLIEAGRLIEVLADHRPEPLTVWGVVAHPRHVAQKVRVFLEYVEHQMNPGSRSDV